jgi:hypothetical protein
MAGLPQNNPKAPGERGAVWVKVCTQLFAVMRKREALGYTMLMRNERMKFKGVQILAVMVVIALVTLGCAVLSRPAAEPPVSGQGSIATAVAATLAAQASQPAPGDTLILPTATRQAVPSPTSSPVPASSATPSEPTQSPELLGDAQLVVASVDPSHNISVWRPGVPSRQITNFGDVDSVKISDDAAWIAFSRTNDFIHYSLWVTRSDGSAGHAIMDLPDFAALPRAPEAVSVMPAAFSWKPGAHILAFSTRPTFEGPGLMMNNDLWLADIDGGTRSELLRSGEGGQFYFSPDGAQIALVQPDAISLVNADGSNRRERVFVYPPVTTYSEYAYYASPVWAPDSSQLLVVIPPTAAIEHPEDPAVLWRIPLDGSTATKLGQFPSALNLYPVIAPGLEKIAFLRLVGPPAENRRELHLANLTGSEDVLYQEAPYLTFYAWAPGSHRFLYATDEKNRLMLGEPGGTAQAAGEQSGVSQVRWVDDQRFLYALNRGASLELHLRSVAGDELLVVAYSSSTSPFLAYDFGLAR